MTLEQAFENDPQARAEFHEYLDEMAEEHVHVAERLHDGDDDPEHDPIGDADTDYDIEYDDDPEDDGQPSEYEEWQDFMGGDDWDHGQCDDLGY